MKQKALNTKKQAILETPPTGTLQSKASTAEKSVEKAWEAYKKKEAAYDEASKESGDKMGLKRLLAAAKIARFTYKIKVVEHKLAKAILKATNKAGKKSGKEDSKAPAKFKAIITTEDQLKSTATNEKSSIEGNITKQASKGKKKPAIKE